MELHSRIDARHCLNPCSAAEINSCNSVLRSSPHSTIKLLPNHHIGQDAQLHGFHFTCSATDLACVLPVGKDVCSMISMYEVLNEDESGLLHPHALDILNNHAANQAKLDAFVQRLDADPTILSRFDCIAQQLEQTVHKAAEFDCVDSRPWKEEISDKVGIYHTFTRSTSKDTRRHKVFIVVSGCLCEAAEEFHNLWQDASNELSCHELLACEELNWLCSTTHCNHNRRRLADQPPLRPAHAPRRRHRRPGAHGATRLSHDEHVHVRPAQVRGRQRLLDALRRLRLLR